MIMKSHKWDVHPLARLRLEPTRHAVHPWEPGRLSAFR